ncbi:unnamed protein product [Absidia cylindrospora]
MAANAYIGKLVAIVGALFLFHSAISTYEHLAYLKAVDQNESSLPIENILMENEIKKMTIDKIDTRPSFITFNHRKVVSTMAQLERKL